MININNKLWDKLDINDVEQFLSGAEGETFFVEFKLDEVNSEKIAKEISAFANTYGGYILLGVDDNKNIVGCTKWTEERIHTTIHDCISPTPNFDIKKLMHEDKIIFIIKIEEGSRPPYITNKGKIYERLSSGSFVINNSDKLSQIYYKREEELKRIEKKLSITELGNGFSNITNLFGYIDIGFSLTTSNESKLKDRLYSIDFSEISNILQEFKSGYSISRVGYSYVISIGQAQSVSEEKVFSLQAGCHNFIEIMPDGSVKCRVVLFADSNTSNVNITTLIMFSALYKRIYKTIFGEYLADAFIYAQKYEKLTVLKQFTPYYNIHEEDDKDEIYKYYLDKHKQKYGNNLIIDGNRIPKNGFMTIDKQFFDEMGIDFNNDEVLTELFTIGHFNLGYIDSPT